MLAWAATGSPFMAPGASAIEVSLSYSYSIYIFIFELQVQLVSDDDEQYYCPASARPSMIANGKILFRTCFSQIIVLRSWLEQLYQQSRELDGPTASLSASYNFKKKFNHWLLFECLSAIGEHSIL